MGSNKSNKSNKKIIVTSGKKDCLYYINIKGVGGKRETFLDPNLISILCGIKQKEYKKILNNKF
jgi:hypothetical protein